MSLKAFHLIFVTLLTTLSFGFAAGRFMSGHRVVGAWRESWRRILVDCLRSLFFEETEKDQLSVKTLRQFSKLMIAAAALAAFAPSPLFACAACYGRSDSPLASGMNWGIFTLLGVVVTVLVSIAGFFILSHPPGSRARPRSSGGRKNLSEAKV